MFKKKTMLIYQLFKMQYIKNLIYIKFQAICDKELPIATFSKLNHNSYASLIYEEYLYKT